MDFCLHYECTEDSDTEKYEWTIGAHACECDVEDESGVLVHELEKEEKNFEKSYENQNLTLTRYKTKFRLWESNYLFSLYV